MGEVLFMKDISFLSYFQSALRNIIVFSTLSMAFIREAVIYKEKNKLYNLVYLLFGFTFLTIGIVLNYVLLKETEKYKNAKNPSERSKDITIDLIIIYAMFIIMLLFLSFTVYRMFHNLIHL